MKKYSLLVLSACIIAVISFSCKQETARLFAGGFTKNGEKGVSFLEFNERNGSLKLISQSDVGPSPAFFSFSEKKGLFYALNEVMEFNGTFGGGLTTLKYNDQNGLMEKKNEFLIPYGGPCYISMSPDSGYLFIANYPNGSVIVVKLDNNGIPETITDSLVYYRESAPVSSHAHMIFNDPSGKKIYVTDLGLDKILAYDFNVKTGKLNLSSNGTTLVPKGYGPRHFVFNSSGSKLYVINELGSKIMVFNTDEQDGLKLIQTESTFRKDFQGNNYCAEIAISKDGRFLYGSNRGENTIVTFNVGIDGLLTLAGHTTCGGNWPRNFVLSPEGRFILVGNQKSDQISVFRIDKKTGLPLEPAKQFSSVAPAYLKFLD
jgi:6-phosphogluconolactonase